MKYVPLGGSGLIVSRIALGMMSYGSREWRPWVLDESAAEPIVRRAVEAGVTFFDTGDHYSAGRSEEITGRLLRQLFRRRESYVVATKVGAAVGSGPNRSGLSRKHILAAVDASLRRLGTEYIDLYQIHRWDPGTPIEETVRALHDIVQSGKVRYLGIGSMFAWQIATACHTAERWGGPAFVSVQSHHNLAHREDERETIPFCRAARLGLIPWSPLARGLLAGNRRRDGSHGTVRAASDGYARRLYSDNAFDVADAVRLVAEEMDVQPAQVALAWLLRDPVVTAPILGATTQMHVDRAVEALDFTLTDRQVSRIEAPYRTRWPTW